MSSFWSKFEQSPCYPDKCQCEFARDEIIRQPSAFWSSFAYIIAGIAIYKYVRTKSLELKLWTFVCILMGLSSLFGHGSFIRAALAMDFASIILVLSFFAFLNLFLMLKFSLRKILLCFSAYYVLLFFAMYHMDKWVKIGTCLIVFTFAIGDVIREMGLSFLKARTLQICLFILTVSFGLFILDENHYKCDPFSPFQLHSLWHIGTAVSMFFYGKWRFDSIAAR